MKLFLYLLGSLTMLAAALTMSLLPRLSPTIWVFIAAGGVLSALIAGSWAVVTASAGSWPRLRTGPVLVAAGLVSLGLALADRWWLEAAWGMVGILTGIPLWVASRRKSARQAAAEPFGVRAPIGHRGQG